MRWWEIVLTESEDGQTDIDDRYTPHAFWAER